MLFNLLLANVTILLCFFFSFRVFLKIFFTMPVDIENERLKLALVISTGALITVANVVIKMLSLVANKTIKNLSN